MCNLISVGGIFQLHPAVPDKHPSPPDQSRKAAEKKEKKKTGRVTYVFHAPSFPFLHVPRA
jgi:hypothetical protein